MSSQHLSWMRRATRLAELCPPTTTAYSVGAVLVDSNGDEIACGYSRDTDPRNHAEESALGKARGDDRLPEATLYSTLEPCSSRSAHRSTCVELILGAGIPRVVIAAREPSLFVPDPQGYELLTAAGVEVVELPGLREGE